MLAKIHRPLNAVPSSNCTNFQVLNNNFISTLSPVYAYCEEINRFTYTTTILYHYTIYGYILLPYHHEAIYFD